MKKTETTMEAPEPEHDWVEVFSGGKYLTIDRYDWRHYVEYGDSPTPQTVAMREAYARRYVEQLKAQKRWGPQPATMADFERLIDQVLGKDDVDAMVGLLLRWREDNPDVAAAVDVFLADRLRDHLSARIKSRRPKR